MNRLINSADTLVDLLRDRADKVPQQRVLRFISDNDADEICLTYQQLDQRAKSIAARLQSRGAAGERALILHAPGPAYVTALLGCFYAGVIAVPAYPPRFNRSIGRLRDIALDAQARFALTTEVMIEKAAQHLQAEPALAALQWLATDDIDDCQHGDEWLAPPIDAHAVALLQYTSGSTSKPKGVALTHANFIYNITALARLRDASQEDRFVSWLPPYHDMGLVGGILLPLCSGIEAILLTPTAFLQRPLRWLSAISRYAGTISGGPNFGYELCVRRIEDAQREVLDLSSWRVAFSGAERVRADTLSRFATAFSSSGFQSTALTPCYGLAEATLGVAFGAIHAAPTIGHFDTAALGKGVVQVQHAEQSATRVVSCGKPLLGCDILIADAETGHEKAPGTVGEIWVKSPGVALGYWCKPELTAQTFNARLIDASSEHDAAYLRTGDLGFLQAEELFVVGRIKDLIVLRGVNYYPEDIELTVEHCHPQLRVASGVAFSIEIEDEEQLMIVQEIDRARDKPLTEILSAIKNAVAEAHELLVYDVVLVAPGGVPKTSSGKVQRNLCRELYSSGKLNCLMTSRNVARDDHAAPMPLIEQIAQLMADLLGVEKVGLDDDFFWLGGHSLLATQLISRARNLFSIDLPLRAIFSASTPRLFAACVAAAPRMSAAAKIEPVDRRQPLSLSFSQERMWVLHQLDPDSSAYNVAGAVLLEGALDVLTLQKSFDQLLLRHEVLRTQYQNRDGVPVLRIMTTAHAPINFNDLSQHQEPYAEALADAAKLARAPFNLDRDLLIRIKLYKTATDTHVLSACLHHLITDAWSMGLLVADLLQIYAALREGIELPRINSRISYVDYAHWQREYFTEARLKDELAYWQKQLAGAEQLELPSDRPRSLRRTAAGAFEPLVLSDEVFASLAALSAAQNATVFMVLLAAFEVLLHRYTGRSDIIVGIPIANRNQLASEPLMGTLVNTLALRLRFNGDPSFTDLLQQVRELALDAYAHQDLPFERLVAELPIERRAGESPLINVMFDFQNAPMPTGAQDTLRMRPLLLSRGASQFDLSLLILDTDLGRIAGVEYSTELFDAATIQRFLNHYLAILKAVVIKPNMAISRIPLLGAEERAELLTYAEKTCVRNEHASSLAELFKQQLTRTPDAAAVSDTDATLTYKQLDHLTGVLAAHLHTAGAVIGGRVAIYLERNNNLLAALLATLKIGACYVPVDPRYPQDRVEYVLRDAEPLVILTERSLLARLPAGMTATVLCMEDVAVNSQLLEPLPSLDVNDTHSAYIIYTSGSTGRPKGVEISRAALANFLRSMRHTPGIDASDRLLSVTTISFDIAGLELFLPLISGAHVYLTPAEVSIDGLLLAELMRNWQPTVMQATPATWKLLIDSGWQGDPRLKILCGGEALSRELAEALLIRSASVWNMYGPTETTIWSTVQQVQPNNSGSVPIGTPIDNTRIYILDHHGELVPKGITGEIYIGGAGVAQGYFKQPALTRERFIADRYASEAEARIYKTGDAGRIRADGALEHLGRLDNQIKIRGYRIEPGEIEVAIKEHPAIRDAVVIAREDRPGDLRLVAYLVMSDALSADLTLTEVIEPLRRRLPVYMLPSAVMRLAALPLTPNGKIDRRALPAPSSEHRDVSDDYLAPRNEIEMRLTELWQQLLNVKKVGIRDSFFMLGGHSLLAVQMFARLQKLYDVALPIAILFEQPTVEYLAEKIACQQTAAPEAAAAVAGEHKFDFIVPIQMQGSKPPLFCVHGAGGNVVNFWAIARYLGTDYPFFGLQARGVDGKTKPLASIEAMAAEYIKELRVIQPHGPYYLSGYCGGGWVAFEMAKALHAQGESIALLALLDCYHPRSQITAPTFKQRIAESRSKGVARYIWDKSVTRVQRDWTSLTCNLRIGVYRFLGKVVPYELRDFWLTKTLLIAAAKYQPNAFSGQLTLLRAKDVQPRLLERSSQLGWNGLATQGIQVLDVPGDHHTLAHEPHVVTLAQTLKNCLLVAEQRIRSGK